MVTLIITIILAWTLASLVAGVYAGRMLYKRDSQRPQDET